MTKPIFAVLLAVFLYSCNTPSYIETTNFKKSPAMNKACIKSINFYTTDNYLKPAPDHPFMSEARKNLAELAIRKLKERGVELLAQCSNTDTELHIAIDVSLFVGIAYPVLNFRITVYERTTALFEMKGRTASASWNKDDILKAQEDIAGKIAQEFADHVKDKK